MNLINFQYEKVRPFVLKLFTIYMFFFFLPFISIQILELETTTIKVLMSLGLIIQIFFFTLELNQARMVGGIVTYFKHDTWNVIESS